MVGQSRLVVALVGIAAVAAVAAVAADVDRNAGASDLWPSHFREGLAALDRDGPPLPPSSSCETCHHDIAADWRASAHGRAADNALFLDGLRAEPNSRCVRCHAPAAAAFNDLAAAARGAALDEASAAHDGVSCAVCHVRDGVVVTAGDGEGYGHALRKNAGLKDPTFCARCHEFSSHIVDDGETRLIDLPLQTTFSEWRAYAAAGGGGTCQSCHMPNGSHALRGSDDATVRGALDVAIEDGIEDGNEDGILVVASRGVGHEFPTGDVFRELVVIGWHGATPTVLAHLGRRFGVRNDVDGTVHQVLEANTALRPGERRRIALTKGLTAVSIEYRRADASAIARGRVALEDLVVEVYRRSLKLDPDIHQRSKTRPRPSFTQQTPPCTQTGS